MDVALNQAEIFFELFRVSSLVCHGSGGNFVAVKESFNWFLESCRLSLCADFVRSKTVCSDSKAKLRQCIEKRFGFLRNGRGIES